jgi:2-dehydro-3-deoxyphosphogluconate aldolase / (4S)-4-hydroxy-2-oxoglutarate aldolase
VAVGVESEVIEALERSRVVAIATLSDPATAETLARGLLADGVSCMEITFRTAAAAEALRRAVGVPGLCVGAGTVLTPEQARIAAALGARFAVAPGLNRAVIETCGELGLPFFPGIATPTELETALALGCRTVKLFPAEPLGGPALVRALSAVYRDVRFIPTGGIDGGNAAAYLELPSVLAVGGSWLVRDA